MIDAIFNKYKTKFSVLNSLDIIKRDAKKIAVYIDLEMIFKSVFTKRVNEYAMNIQDDNDVKLSFVSSILNLAQHYRWYFVKHGYDCEAFIFWNYPTGEYKNYMFTKDYRSYYNNKIYNSIANSYLSECLFNVVPTITSMAKYMNGINIITSDTIESSVLPYIIYREYYKSDSSIQNIIVSNDKYNFQYVNYGYRIIVPKGDDTVVLTSDNIVSFMKESFRIKSDQTISSKHIDFVLSIIGCKYRNLNKIAGIGLGTIIKLINSAIDKILITDQTKDLHSLAGLINEKYREQFITNYNCINVDKQYRCLTPIEIHSIISSIHHKYDDNTLAYLNDKYFQKHPLTLFYNYKQQVSHDDQTTKSIFTK